MVAQQTAALAHEELSSPQVLDAPTPGRPRLIILGSGFGAFSALKKLILRAMKW